MVFFEVIAALILVDFLSGVLHWVEDSYGNPDMPVIGKYVTKPNIEHHFDPTKFTKSPVWRRNRVTVLISLVVCMPIFCFSQGVSVFWISVFVLGLLSNEIHCWAHRTKGENGRIISFLQSSHVIQSPRHHAHHHSDPKKDAYCVITDFLNPVLDRIRFFRGLEFLVAKLFGVLPRRDESIRIRAKQTLTSPAAAPPPRET